MKTPDPNEEREDGWTIEDIYRERGYSSEEIERIVARNRARLADLAD